MAYYEVQIVARIEANNKNEAKEEVKKDLQNLLPSYYKMTGEVKEY